MIGDEAGEKKKCLTIGVLKRIEFSPSDMRDMSVLFVSIFATALFESCTINAIKMIFAHDPCNARTQKKKRKRRHDNFFDDSDEDDEGDKVQQSTQKEDLSELRESLSVFFLQYMASSPKNVEGTLFHRKLLAAVETCENANE